MKFDLNIYLKEMKSMVDEAITKIGVQKPNFEIFTASIWTDPNSASSSIGFDSKSNSDKKVLQSNQWNKKYYDQYKAEGDLEQAKLFESTETRNTNPAEFDLTDFVEIENKTIEFNWEENTNGKCWDNLELVLKEVGEYTFSKIQVLKTHHEFELSTNGRQDWYEFVWRNYE